VDNTFVVVDVSNLAYRAAYGNKDLKTSTGRFSGHVFGAASSLFAYMRNELAGLDLKWVFCYDGKNSKDHRRTILPGYKAKRAPKDIDPLPEVVEFIRKWPGLHIMQDDKEGDDAIAFTVQMRQGKPSIVISGDRDLWALMRFPNCRILSPNLKRFVEDADVVEEYHLNSNPGRIYLAKALFGDSSDDIKGIERLIKKQFAAILNAADIETPEQFYCALGTSKPANLSDKTWVKLQAGKETVCKNYQVVLPQLGFDKSSVTKVDKGWGQVTEALKEWECFSQLQYVPYNA
jgi:5'-3' exonuclease